MALKKQATAVFDPVRFGELVRSERKKRGFSSTPKLSEAIKDKTGVYIDPDTLHKIERGEREPDVTKLIAICSTIYENTVSWYMSLGYLLQQSQPIDFAFSEPKYILEREYIEQYRDAFNKSPSFDHVKSTCNFRLPNKYISGSENEVNFAVSFRTNSKKFAKAKEAYELEQLTKQKPSYPDIYF